MDVTWKSVSRCVLLCILVAISGCAEDCPLGNFFKYASLKPDTLPGAIVGVAYDASVYAEIENEPDDDSYDYDLSISEGHLPPGILFHQDGRAGIFSGTPTAAGNFSFTLRVRAEPPYEYDVDPLCSFNEEADQDFTIAVSTP